MTAHPKQKVTKSRAGKRKAHHALKATNLVPCDKCGEKKVPHRVCPACGTYKGKQIMKMKTKKK